MRWVVMDAGTIEDALKHTKQCHDSDAELISLDRDDLVHLNQ